MNGILIKIKHIFIKIKHIAQSSSTNTVHVQKMQNYSTLTSIKVRKKSLATGTKTSIQCGYSLQIDV